MKKLATTSFAIAGTIVLLLFAAIGATSAASAAPDLALIVCAPGYPGSTVEAQPAMDGLAAAVIRVAGWSEGSLTATYFEDETAGVQRLAEQDAGFALVTLPFFLKHRHELELQAKLQVAAAGRTASESWSLVAGAGLVKGSQDLADWELVSLAGHAPRFIRGPALGGWGALPDSTTITFSGAVLRSLRRAARGEKTALLLDGQQAASLERLPFAKDLEVVYQSPPLPVSLLCSVGKRVTSSKLSEAVEAFKKLNKDAEAAPALAGVRLEGFSEIDSSTLERAEKAFDGITE